MKALFVVGLDVVLLGILSFFIALLHPQKINPQCEPPGMNSWSRAFFDTLEMRAGAEGMLPQTFESNAKAAAVLIPRCLTGKIAGKFNQAA